MNRNKIELLAIGVLAVVGKIGFCFSHSHRPYELAQIQFCPQTANTKSNILKDKHKANKLKYYDLQAQEKLDKNYCYTPRYVLAEEWDKYGRYGSIIPYMGSTISLVSIIKRDNPYQIYGNITSLLGLWGISFVLIIRVNRLKKTDYQLAQEEKTTAYQLWQQNKYKREIKSHTYQLHTDKMKDSLSQLDLEERIELGITDDENEAIKNQLIKEDYLKARAVTHSQMDKEIAANILDKHKSEKEIARLNNKKSISPSNATQPTSQQLINSLIEALKTHEDGWLYSIIKNAKPLWLIGSQGSGKTNTAAAIALIRKYCFSAPIYQLIDRHATGENWEVWKLLDAVLKAESEEEIGQAIIDATDRWLQRIKEKPSTKQQIIIDEFTNLKKIYSCKEAAMKFFSMHLTDTRKAKEYFIGVNHYFTNESTVEGTFEARKSGTIQLKKFSANGETPLSRVQIVHGLVDENGNELEEVERTLPNWLEANNIYRHFNGNAINFE